MLIAIIIEGIFLLLALIIIGVLWKVIDYILDKTPNSQKIAIDVHKYVVDHCDEKYDCILFTNVELATEPNDCEMIWDFSRKEDGMIAVTLRLSENDPKYKELISMCDEGEEHILFCPATVYKKGDMITWEPRGL